MDSTAINQFVCDLHICGSCQKRFSDLCDFVEHKKHCSKPIILNEVTQDGSSIYRETRRMAECAEGKFVQTVSELPIGNTELAVGGQVQQQSATSNAVGVLALSMQNFPTEKSVIPSSETAEGQSSVFQVQTPNGLQVFGNISLQELLVLAAKQQQQQVFQSQEQQQQQLQAIVQQQQQQLPPVVDVTEAAVTKTDTITYTGTVPILQLVDTSRSLQDGDGEHEPAVIAEVLQQNVPGQVIQTLLQPGLTTAQLEQHIKDGTIQQVLSAVQNLQGGSPADPHKPSASISNCESAGRVEIQISSVDSDQKTEASGFGEHHVPGGTAAKTDSSHPTEKSSLKLCYGCTFKGCNYVTQYSKNVERHMLIHTGEKPFVCTECNSKFSRSDKLKNHQRVHTGDKPYKCNQCDYRCGDNSSLKKHKRIHSDERPFKCQICSYASRNSSQLTIHLRTHTGDKPFMCPECCATFKIKSDLNRHRRMHTGEKPYACSLCDFRTAINSNLKAHMKTYHCEENMVECKKCDFRTSSKRVFKTHMKIHLPADQRLHCPQCSYTCTNIRLMKTHIRIHSDERPFACTLCRYNTKTRTCLNSHMRNHHPKEYFAKHSRRQSHAEAELSKTQKRVSVIAKCMEKFRCDICGAGFVRADSLRSHIKSHQEKAVYDSEKKQKSQEVAVGELSASGASPALNQQPADEAQPTGISSNAYSISQEHEYAAVTQEDAYRQSSAKSAGVSSELLTTEVVSTRKQNAAHELQSILPFIQNNHNTAVWENMQNLAALNHGESHASQDVHGRGHDHQSSQDLNQDTTESSQQGQHRASGLTQTDHLLSSDQEHAVTEHQGTPVVSSSCDVYSEQSAVEIIVEKMIETQGSPMCAETGLAEDCSESSENKVQALAHLVQDVVSFGAPSTKRSAVPVEVNYTPHDGQQACSNSQTTILLSSGSQRPELLTSDSKVMELVVSDAQKMLDSATQDSGHVFSSIINPSEQEARCSTSVTASDVTDAKNITVFSVNNHTNEVLKALSLSKSAVITVPCSSEQLEVETDNTLTSQLSGDVVVENNNSSVNQKSDLSLIVQSMYSSTAKQQ